MGSFKVDAIIIQIEKSFYRLGLWHRGEEATPRESAKKLFFSVYTLLLPISLLSGVSLTSEGKEDKLFLIEAAIMTVIMSVKILYIIWRKDEILQMLDQIGNYSIKNASEAKRINHRLKMFMNFMKIFFSCSVLIGVCAMFIVPFIGSERKLFFNIGFPLNWRHSEFAFWAAFTFILTEVALSAISILFSVIMWYLFLNCGLRFEALGHDLRDMGIIEEVVDVSGNKRKISKMEKENQFAKDLVAAIKSYREIIDVTGHLEAFLSHIHSTQIGFSGLCICGSIYCLGYNKPENSMEFIIYIVILTYNIFDVFMITYFGNELNLSSDRLSYCLFQSSWYEYQFCSKSILILGERFKQPVELVILKLYPLTLELFVRILNNAYSMFNILKTFAERV
ncbi:odorant receptor 94b-like [Bradysia coprophila]|uniref:odorant receptor 94b-like n=1 Tax=Bradysia coprophila TaxID=38358 RepID=UPI00187D8C87|nr:odorant receptor 94b-like [Bradysia coprophila]